MAWIRACGGENINNEKYIIKNGIIKNNTLTAVSSSASNIAKRCGHSIYTQLHNAIIQDTNAVRLVLGRTGGSDGTYYDFRTTSYLTTPIDVTDFKKIVFEFDEQGTSAVGGYNSVLYFGISTSSPSAGYSLLNYKIINTTTTKVTHGIEIDVSSISGYVYIVIMSSSPKYYSTTWNDTIWFKNIKILK